MKYVSLLSMLVFIAACDVPSGNRRQIFNTPMGNAVTAPAATPTPGQPAPSTSPGTIPNTPPSTTPTSPTTGVGFENCSLAAKGTSPTVGAVGICQSTADETMVRFQTTVSDSMTRTCLIPTYKDASGSSTYIGQPQCTFTVAGTIYNGKLYKTRAGFENYPLNGVIIMKEDIMTGYFNCMNAYSWYSQNYASQQTYVTCYNQYRMYYPNAAQLCIQQGATNHQATVCTSYKSSFGTQYLDLRLK